MDIQVASNFERLIFDATYSNSKRVLKLMNNLHNIGEFKLDKEELKRINETFCSESLSDKECKKIIEAIKRKNYKSSTVGFGGT